MGTSISCFSHLTDGSLHGFSTEFATDDVRMFAKDTREGMVGGVSSSIEYVDMKGSRKSK